MTDRVNHSVKRWVLLYGITVVCAPTNCLAATITVGNHDLLPNTSGQVISIFVSGGDAVAGLNLFAQVGDGGPELSDFGLPPGTDGPSITSFDLKTDTIFAQVTSSQDDQIGVPQVAISSIEFTTPGVTTPAEGLLATLTIDTTGFSSGNWNLILKGVLPNLAGGPFDTDFAGVPAMVLNGSINLIPLSVVGDLDGDGEINRNDLILLLGNYGTNSGAAAAMGDLDGDTIVGLSDLGILGNQFGQSTSANSPSARSVPEPAGAMLVVIGIALACFASSALRHGRRAR